MMVFKNVYMHLINRIIYLFSKQKNTSGLYQLVSNDFYVSNKDIFYGSTKFLSSFRPIVYKTTRIQNLRSM